MKSKFLNVVSLVLLMFSMSASADIIRYENSNPESLITGGYTFNDVTKEFYNVTFQLDIPGVTPIDPPQLVWNFLAEPGGNASIMGGAITFFIPKVDLYDSTFVYTAQFVAQSFQPDTLMIIRLQREESVYYEHAPYVIKEVLLHDYTNGARTGISFRGAGDTRDYMAPIQFTEVSRTEFTTAVPEADVYAMMLFGLAMIGFRVRKS